MRLSERKGNKTMRSRDLLVAELIEILARLSDEDLEFVFQRGCEILADPEREKQTHVDPHRSSPGSSP